MSGEQTPTPPRLVLIAGGSCSGKTTLARALMSALERAVIVSMDWYYHDLAHMSEMERAAWNFDHPDAIDVALLTEHMRKLRRAEAIDAPAYDFVTHTRRGERQTLPAAPYVIVEGIHALYWEDLRTAADARVFIDLEHAACLTRRVKRDTDERGRDADAVSRQFAATVLPMFEAHVAQVRGYADVVVRGDEALETSVTRIIRHLHGMSPVIPPHTDTGIQANPDNP
ncbi:MAG: uridine kinase [Candidatus Hydrogenedentales bacterium]